MSMEADKLRTDIATAERRLAELEAKACQLSAHQRSQVEHQIARAKDTVRDMRIKLASIDPQADRPCPNCKALMPHSFEFCRVCIRELPLKLYARLKGAVGLAHHKYVTAPYLDNARAAALSHLKQHSSAL